MMLLLTGSDHREILLRLVVAAALGGLVGLERDIHGRSAGLRTHMLVCLGSALFMVVSEVVSRHVPAGSMFADPGRIAAQVVTGIGFLGAGVIIKDLGGVRGLTTAACLWIAAAIGMAAGAGAYSAAVMGTVMAIFALMILKPVENFYRKHAYRTLQVVTDGEIEASKIIDVVKTHKITVVTCDIERDYKEQSTKVTLTLRLLHKGITDKLAHGVVHGLEESAIPLKTVSWSK